MESYFFFPNYKTEICFSNKNTEADVRIKNNTDKLKIKHCDI